MYNTVKRAKKSLKGPKKNSGLDIFHLSMYNCIVFSSKTFPFNTGFLYRQIPLL